MPSTQLSTIHKPPRLVLNPKHEMDTLPHSEKGDRFSNLPRIAQLGRGGVRIQTEAELILKTIFLSSLGPNDCAVIQNIG